MYSGLIIHDLFLIFFSKHRIWILFSLFCFFCLLFFFLCLFFLPLLFSFFFLLCFEFVFLFYFLLLLIFLDHFKGRRLKGWPWMRGVTFSWMRRLVTFFLCTLLSEVFSKAIVCLCALVVRLCRFVASAWFYSTCIGLTCVKLLVLFTSIRK